MTALDRTARQELGRKRRAEALEKGWKASMHTVANGWEFFPDEQACIEEQDRRGIRTFIYAVNSPRIINLRKDT